MNTPNLTQIHLVSTDPAHRGQPHGGTKYGTGVPMFKRLKGFVIAGALLALSLTSTATASAASQPLTIDTGSYICSNSVCDLGSGNVGAFFAGVVTSFGGQGPTPYTWSVGSGSLPTDMLLTPSYGVYSAYLYGIPTAAGTTTLTLQVRDGVGDTAQQSFSFTINPGTPTPPDSVTISSAKWSARQHRVYIVATDPLRYLTLTASLTSTGQPLCTLFSFGSGQYTGSFFSQANPQTITVKTNLGASATVAVIPIK